MSNNTIPRRVRIDLFSKEEKAIYDVQQMIEHMEADPILTDVGLLLSQARNRLADYVDKQISKETRQN